MKIRLQSVHFKASKKLETLVNEKVEKLFLLNEKILRADVILHKEANGKPDNQCCEITLLVPGKNLFAKKSAGKYEQSIAAAAEALRKKIRRKKEQMVSGKKKKAA